MSTEYLSEPYDEPSGGYDEEPGDRRRRERVKKPPVPVLPDGTWVRIGDSCRSSTLRGQVGTVISWGRQVEVLMRDDSEGAARKINPTDLIALSEEPELTAAKPEQAVDDSGGDSLGLENLKVTRGGRAKKPPVPVLPDGTWVRIGDSCRSSTLRGQVGTVISWGRQVEVLMRDDSEGAARKINPTDLIALSEEPELTAAEEADGRSDRDSGESNLLTEAVPGGL
jgi:hypothetical protein